MILLSSFVFGLVSGSFLNVVIYRLHPVRRSFSNGVKNGRNIVFGRSFCPECKTQLRWCDLIPLLSFIYLRGRCRYCHKKISWQYPVVEILSGFIWVGVFYQNFNNNFQFSIFNFQLLNVFYQIFILSILLVIAVYDFKWRIIPDKIVYPAVIIVLIYNLFNAFSAIGGSASGGKLENLGIFIWSFVVASAAFLFFFLFFYFSKGRAMGLGDAKLAFLVGLFLSPLLTIVAFMSAFIIGAAFGIILIGFGKKTLKSQIAFGPFLILGATIAFFLSDFINNFFIF